MFLRNRVFDFKMESVLKSMLCNDIVQLILEFDPTHRDNYELVLDELRKGCIWLKLRSEGAVQTRLSVFMYYMKRGDCYMIGNMLNFYAS